MIAPRSSEAATTGGTDRPPVSHSSSAFVTPAKETTDMSKGRLSGEQLLGFLKQAEAGRPVAEV